MEPRVEDALAPFAEPALFGENVLRPLCELNRGFLALLVNCAAEPESAAALPFIRRLRPDLRALDPVACGRLAACPVALADLGFADADRWHRVSTQAMATEDCGQTVGRFSPAPAQRLTHSTLALAWSLASTSREAAAIVFGLHPLAADAVARLDLQGIQDLAERYAHWLRPRWEDCPDIWPALLRLARCPASRTPPLSQYVLQRQLAELVPGALLHRATGANRPGRHLRR